MRRRARHAFRHCQQSRHAKPQTTSHQAFFAGREPLIITPDPVSPCQDAVVELSKRFFPRPVSLIRPENRFSPGRERPLGHENRFFPGEEQHGKALDPVSACLEKLETQFIAPETAGNDHRTPRLPMRGKQHRPQTGQKCPVPRPVGMASTPSVIKPRDVRTTTRGRMANAEASTVSLPASTLPRSGD